MDRANDPTTARRSGLVLNLQVSMGIGLLAALLIGWALSVPWQARIDIGGRYDAPFVDNFHFMEYSTEHALDFRWSRPAATLLLPGVGQVASLELRVHGDYAGMPLHLDTGAGVTTVQLQPGWQRVLLLPRAQPGSGDAVVALETLPHLSLADRRIRGVALDWVEVRGGAGSQALGQAAMLGMSVALATLLAGWASGSRAIGGLVGLAATAGLAGILAWDGGSLRLLVTVYSWRLALVLGLACGVAAGVVALLRLLAARGVLTSGPGMQRALAAAVMLTFLVRFAGLAYPLNFNSDLRFNVGRAWMVRSGELLHIFLPNLTLTPVQWDMDVTVPRSPFFYILMAPMTFLPGPHGDELGILAFSSLVDGLAGLLVALLVLYAGGSGRAATMAVVLAALHPFGILLMVSWGIFATLIAQALALLAAVVWLLLLPRLHERWAELLFAGSLALAYLAYPTALVFMGATWFFLVLLLAWRRDRATLPTLRAGIVAVVAAFVLYYGWHVPELAMRTLPTIFERFAGGSGMSGTRTFDAIWVPVLAKYGALTLWLAGGGGLLLLARRLGTRAGYVRLLLVAWLLSYLPAALGDEYLVTFILKHLIFLLPLCAILGGLLLGRLAQRRWGLLVAVVLLAVLGWQGLLMELDVIVNAFTQLK